MHRQSVARSPVKVQVVNHLFKVESSNVVVPEVNYDLICISFPLVIRNNNVLIQHAYSGRRTLRSQHPCAETSRPRSYSGPGAGWRQTGEYTWRGLEK